MKPVTLKQFVSFIPDLGIATLQAALADAPAGSGLFLHEVSSLSDTCKRGLRTIVKYGPAYTFGTPPAPGACFSLDGSASGTGTVIAFTAPKPDLQTLQEAAAQLDGTGISVEDLEAALEWAECNF